MSLPGSARIWSGWLPVPRLWCHKSITRPEHIQSRLIIYATTAIFRPCQDGTDFLLWQAGYWAFDRYDHWEHGGWNLDIVYHQNPCKLNRLCSTKEEWDAGRLEAELLAITATPEATITPFAVEVTVVKEIEIDVVWETLDRATTAKQLLGRSSVDPSPPGELYNPPLEPLRNKISTGSLYGEFRFNRESVTVSCQYWHNARKEPTEFVKSREFSVNIKKLGDELDCKNRNFNDDIDDDDVVSRQWKITVARSYTGRGQIRNVSWKLSATYGVEPNAECVSATTGEFNNTGPCKLNLEDEQDVEKYLSDYIDKARDKGMPTTIVEDFINPTSSMCTGRKSTEEVGDDEDHSL